MSSKTPMQEASEDLQQFMMTYLGTHLVPLVPNTTEEQRKPLWDHLKTIVGNENDDDPESTMEKEGELCFDLIFIEVGGDLQKGNALFDKVVGVIDEAHQETMVYARLKGQKLMKEMFGIDFKSILVEMGGGIKDEKGNWAEFDL